MELELTSDQQLMRDAVRRFAEAELLPRARQADATAIVDPSVTAGLADLGLFGLLAPAEHGGAEQSLATTCVALGELAAADASAAVSVAMHGAVVAHLVAHGSADQKSRWLPVLATGEVLGAWVYTDAAVEPDGRLAARAPWVINGAGAGLYLVVARASDGLVVFELSPATGIEADPFLQLGLRSLDTAALRLDVRPQARVGQDATVSVATTQARIQVLLGAAAAGLGFAALDVARRYALDRKQFGKPISDFQAIQWKLADAATELDAARLLVLDAAQALDRGAQALAPAAQAKRFAAEAASKAAFSAIQVLGGNGFVREYPVERYMREARFFQIAEGSGVALRSVVAAALLR